jgi:hypothetical protein
MITEYAMTRLEGKKYRVWVCADGLGERGICNQSYVTLEFSIFNPDLSKLLTT